MATQGECHIIDTKVIIRRWSMVMPVKINTTRDKMWLGWDRLWRLHEFSLFVGRSTALLFLLL